MTTSVTVRPPPPVPEPKPMIIPGRTVGEQILVKIFVLIPFAALIAAVPIAWILEKLGWAHDVRWTNPARLARVTADRTTHLPPRTTPRTRR